MVEDMNGLSLDIDSYVKNTKTLRVGKIVKIVRQKKYDRQIETRVICTPVIPASQSCINDNYSQTTKFLIKCDEKGIPA